MADLSASRVQQYLANLRERRRALPALDPAQLTYTKAELAGLLGVTASAIPAMVRRHRLAASGYGKARRYPKATVEALRSLRTRGRSIKTSNLYLDAMKQFVAWLVQDRRMPDNPLAHLSGGNVKLDRRHDRRTLTADELRSAIQAAGLSDRVFRGVTGADRAMLYSVACASGFRAAELASLCPDAFALDGEPPTVTLAAEHAKNGRTAVQPLPAGIVEALRDYLAGRPADQPIWPGTWPKKAAEMISLDLDAAGIPYVVEGTDGPLYADFHSLRHSFIALLDRSGATLKEAMQLARHSDPKLTMAVYGRAHLHDLGEAVGRLPGLLIGLPVADAALAATATEGEPAIGLPLSLRSACATADAESESLRLADAYRGSEGGNAAGRNPLDLQGVEAGCDSLIPSEESSPTRTRTWNKPVNRRLLSPPRLGQNRNSSNMLRQNAPVCKHGCTLARACETIRKTRDFRKQVGGNSEEFGRPEQMSVPCECDFASAELGLVRFLAGWPLASLYPGPPVADGRTPWRHSGRSRSPRSLLRRCSRMPRIHTRSGPRGIGVGARVRQRPGRLPVASGFSPSSRRLNQRAVPISGHSPAPG
jgi:integrase